MRRSLQPWERSDARGYHLGSAVYPYLYLFGGDGDSKPDAFDWRFRIACDHYNYALSWALGDRGSPDAVVRLEGGRRLPVGETELHFIVRRGHSCQDQPAAIEAVRRILHQHLNTISASGTPPPP